MKLRLFCIIVLFCLPGCSDTKNTQSSSDIEIQTGTSITFRNLVYIDPSSSITQYPLVCGAGRDFPFGYELEFQNSKTKKSIHAVFPESKRAPSNLNGSFILKGHFQSIQNKNSYKLKKPGKDYRYFVVSEWRYEK